MSRPLGSCTHCPLSPQCDLMEECVLRQTYQRTGRLEESMAAMCQDVKEIKTSLGNGTLVELVEAAKIIKHVWYGLCGFGRFLKAFAIGVTAIAAMSAVIWQLIGWVR